MGFTPRIIAFVLRGQKLFLLAWILYFHQFHPCNQVYQHDSDFHGQALLVRGLCVFRLPGLHFNFSLPKNCTLAAATTFTTLVFKLDS